MFNFKLCTKMIRGSFFGSGEKKNTPWKLSRNCLEAILVSEMCLIWNLSFNGHDLPELSISHMYGSLQLTNLLLQNKTIIMLMSITLDDVILYPAVMRMRMWRLLLFVTIQTRYNGWCYNPDIKFFLFGRVECVRQRLTCTWWWRQT